MKCLAEFELISDFTMEQQSSRLALQHPNGRYQCYFKSNMDTERSKPNHLLADIIFDAPDLSSAIQVGRDHLIDAVNVLAMVACGKLEVGSCCFVFDWTLPGRQSREARFYSAIDPQDREHHELSAELFETAAHLLRDGYSERLKGAMRWFRLGLGSDPLEEQFQNFWLSLELAATNGKSTQKVHDLCPRCKGKLYCEVCQDHPQHRMYDKQAIRSVVEKIAPQVPDLFDHLSLARNTLLHGDRLETIEKRLPCSLERLVDILAEVSRTAIINEQLRCFPKEEALKPFSLLTFNTVVRRKMDVGAILTTTVAMSQEGTLEDDYKPPAVKIELIEQQ